MAYQNVGSLGHSVVRSHRAVGPDVEGEPFVVRDLANPRRFDGVIDLPDRRKNRIDRNHPDWEAVPMIARLISLAALDREIDVQASLGRIKRGQMKLWIHDLDVGWCDEV